VGGDEDCEKDHYAPHVAGWYSDSSCRPSSVFSQTVQGVLRFVLPSHYTRLENKMCLILEH